MARPPDVPRRTTAPSRPGQVRAAGRFDVSRRSSGGHRSEVRVRRDARPCDPASRRRRVPTDERAKRSRKGFFRRYWWAFLLTLRPRAARGRGPRGAYARIDLPKTLPPVQTTFVYDRNGDLLSTFHGAVDRTLIPLRQMPQHLRDAVIAVEDARFYEHDGVDVRGTIRAAWQRPRRARDRPGRLDDHAAAREARVRGTVRRGERRHGLRGAAADREGEGPRGAPRGQGGAHALEGPDPVQLPEHGVLRPRGLRDRGRRPDVLRHPGPAPPVAVRDLAGILTAPEAYDRSTIRSTRSSGGTSRSTGWCSTATSTPRARSG